MMRRKLRLFHMQNADQILSAADHGESSSHLPAAVGKLDAALADSNGDDFARHDRDLYCEGGAAGNEECERRS